MCAEWKKTGKDPDLKPEPVTDPTSVLFQYLMMQIVKIFEIFLPNTNNEYIDDNFNFFIDNYTNKCVFRPGPN